MDVNSLISHDVFKRSETSVIIKMGTCCLIQLVSSHSPFHPFQHRFSYSRISIWSLSRLPTDLLIKSQVPGLVLKVLYDLPPVLCQTRPTMSFYSIEQSSQTQLFAILSITSHFPSRPLTMPLPLGVWTCYLSSNSSSYISSLRKESLLIPAGRSSFIL